MMLNPRVLVGLLSAAAMAPSGALSEQLGNPVLKRVRTGTPEIAYEDSVPEMGFPVLLLHGFPYDQRCYDGWCRHSLRPDTEPLCRLRHGPDRRRTAAVSGDIEADFFSRPYVVEMSQFASDSDRQKPGRPRVV